MNNALIQYNLYRLRYAKSETDDDGRWITLNGGSGDEGSGGTRVKTDKDGKILAGPKGLKDNGIESLSDFGGKKSGGERKEKPQEAAKESAEKRFERLGVKGESEDRMKKLKIAHEADVDDEVMRKLVDAMRLEMDDKITLPRHRFAGLSRGRGWARKGTGKDAEWGEKTAEGYVVGPGYWSVGGHDGFNRKGADDWTVEHVKVGDKTWTIAN